MMIHRFLFTALAAVSLLALTAVSASAEDELGVFGDWSAFSDGKGKSRICYMASVPTKETGKYKTRGDSFMLITHRPAEKARDVVELRAGYTYKKDSEVTVTIGTTNFNLFTDGGTAWAKDAKTDRALAQAMIRGASMIVKGTSTRGTLTTDTYSLKGFSAAHKAIGKACGVK